MSTRHVDPYTGEPLEGRPQGAQPIYIPEPDEPDDDEDMRLVEGGDKPHGFIHTHDRQRGAKFRMSIAIPVIMVSHLAAVMVGAFALLLGARGTLETHADVLVPALIIGGWISAVGGVLASLYIWPQWVAQGPLRTITYGLVSAALILALVVLAIGLIFA